MSWRERFEAPVRDVAARHRGTNWVRAAVARITTPLLPDDYLHLANPLWSARELRGRVVSVRRETADSATIEIKPGWGFSFDYQPGQYLGIGVDVGGRWIWRSYSLTSAPERAERTQTVSITVKAMPEGFLSSHLVKGLKPGTIVRLAAPAGEFVLPEPLPEKLLFLTAGSGVTPIISMLRTVAHRKQRTDIVLIHSAPSPDDVLFGDELAGYAESGLVDVHLHHTVDSGRLTEVDVETICADWAQRETWACGPAGFLDLMSGMFDRAGAAEHLHLERFALERGAAGDQGGEVTFTRSGKTTTVDGATTLLEAGEASGVLMPFGCRMGICQSCVVPVEAGVVRDLRTGVEHVAGERIQTCVSAAAGDCSLDV
ncbi:NADPH oxidoreductase [Gordonia araii NBRC 100433]|uniref:NADPH oxidoreductase n=1 Tax=Gordonia araii NBRC 100433 TaxID=1073574 RepID=G7H298_9ACTN|nr:ferredoxin reductase [Gordonia araii]NNG97512.1 ferredoxin reductase [Gordonia araii NBRC 100433]GAB09973.1 NADPH oxidoreductase [Gordonia araii NBRC 100433]